MRSFQSQQHARNSLAMMMEAARRNEIIILCGVRTQTQHENLKNCIWTSVIVPRTLYHKNYKRTFRSSPEDIIKMMRGLR